MKLKKINLTNFAGFMEFEASFSNNVTYLIGKNGAGKTTVGLDVIWAALQGIAAVKKGEVIPLPGTKDEYIGKAGASANISISLVDHLGQEVRVARNFTKSKQTLKIDGPEGVTLDQDWLNGLFNLHLIAPRRFLELTPKQQAGSLGIDTDDFDACLQKLKETHTNLKRDDNKIVVPDPVEEVVGANAGELMGALASANQFNLSVDQRLAIKASLEEDNVSDRKYIIEKEEEIRLMRGEIVARTERLAGIDSWIEQNPRLDISVIETKIFNINETNNKANLYQAYIKSIADKEVSTKALAGNRAEQKEIEVVRGEYLATQNLPFPELSINEAGELLYNDRYMKHLSSGEALRIVPVLMAEKSKSEFKYIFLQDFQLLDNDNQREVIKDLTSRGFQLLIEFVGDNAGGTQNCIMLKDCGMVG